MSRSVRVVHALGLSAVTGLTTHSREYVAWGWAVNGFVFVIGGAEVPVPGALTGVPQEAPVAGA